MTGHGVWCDIRNIVNQFLVPSSRLALSCTSRALAAWQGPAVAAFRAEEVYAVFEPAWARAEWTLEPQPAVLEWATLACNLTLAAPWLHSRRSELFAPVLDRLLAEGCTTSVAGLWYILAVASSPCLEIGLADATRGPSELATRIFVELSVHPRGGALAYDVFQRLASATERHRMERVDNHWYFELVQNYLVTPEMMACLPPLLSWMPTHDSHEMLPHLCVLLYWRFGDCAELRALVRTGQLDHSWQYPRGWVPSLVYYNEPIGLRTLEFIEEARGTRMLVHRLGVQWLDWWLSAVKRVEQEPRARRMLAFLTDPARLHPRYLQITFDHSDWDHATRVLAKYWTPLPAPLEAWQALLTHHTLRQCRVLRAMGLLLALDAESIVLFRHVVSCVGAEETNYDWIFRDPVEINTTPQYFAHASGTAWISIWTTQRLTRAFAFAPACVNLAAVVPAPLSALATAAAVLAGRYVPPRRSKRLYDTGVRTLPLSAKRARRE